MFVFLSPAKNMIAPDECPVQSAEPRFTEKTSVLLNLLKEYSSWELESLLKLSPPLALSASAQFQEFEQSACAWPALLSYHGLAYQHLRDKKLNRQELLFAQEHLRIFSAFYGPLRPLDGIKPYRLDFACGLKPEGRSLYHFWGDLFYRDLFFSGEPVINLASAEYAKAVKPWLKPHDRLITCEFKTLRNGKLITLPTDAKMMRGRMAYFILSRRLLQPEKLQAFRWDGYQFSKEMSDPSTYYFIRTWQ